MKNLVKIVLVISMLSGLTAGMAAGCSTFGDSNASGSSDIAPKVGKYAPDFHLLDLEGKETFLIDFRGKPVMLNVWASWCGPCVNEMPLIQEVYDTWADDGLVILAVNSGESTAHVKQFIEAQGFSFPVLLDGDQTVTLGYNVRGIPATFFINPDGVIEEIKVGGFTSQAQIEASLKKILP